jgi:cytochrome P450
MGERENAVPAVEEMTSVTTYADVAAVLNSLAVRQALHHDRALKQEFGPTPSDEFLGESLLSLHGDEHFNRRRLESRLFTKPSRAQLELDVVWPALHRLLQRSQGTSTDLMVFSRLVLIRVSGAVVGLAPIEDLETADRLRSLAEDMFLANGVRYLTENQDEITRRGLESRDAFRREFYAPAVRALTVQDAPDHGGLLSLLAEKPDTVSSEVMFREAILFLIASSTTTTNALPHAIWDAERWFARHPDERAAMSEFAFCRLIATEALRLHPPVPRLLRRSTEPMTLPSGLKLRAGEFLALDLISSSQDPDVFGEDAGEFNPLRALQKGVWPFGFAFGGGAHMCIGRTLVLGDGGTREDETEPQGLFPRFLRELYKAGMRLDAERSPTRREGTEKNEYVEFPVAFGTAA